MSRKTKKSVYIKSNIYPLKFSKKTDEIRAYSTANVKLKHLSEEIEIFWNNFELVNQTDKNKKDNHTFTNLS